MVFMRKKKVQFLRRCILCILAIFTSFWTPYAYAEQTVLGPVITIVKQPDSRVDAYLGSSISGLLLEIEANVTSDASLYYQWYSNTADSNVGGTVIDGATGDTLYLPFYNSVTDGSLDNYEEGHYEPAFDPGSYYFFCEVNADGAIPVRSNVTTFNVFPKPEGEIIITQQPSDITVTAGNITESLSIAYQQTLNADVYWFCNTTNSNQGGTRITYAPSDTFPIPRDLAPGTYYYYCLIQEPPGTPGGARHLVSDVAVVSVIPPSLSDPLYTFDGVMEIIPPQKTKYYEGECLDTTGMIIHEVSGIKYSDGSTKITQRKEIKQPVIALLDKPLSKNDTYVTVSGWSELLSTNISGTFEITVIPIPGIPDIYFDGGIKIIPPYKTDYIEGEYLDITGLIAYEVSGTIYTDGSKLEILNELKNVKIDLLNRPLTCEDTKVKVSGYGDMFLISLSSTFDIIVHPAPDASITQIEEFNGVLEINPPDKTEYIEGEYINTKGLEIYETAGLKYSDGSTRTTYRKKVEPSEIDLNNKPLSVDNKSVTVKVWSEKLSAEISGSFNIVVHPPIKTYINNDIEIVLPQKTEYFEGEFLDTSGLLVYETSKVIYNDDSFKIQYKREIECPHIDLLNKPLSRDDKYVTISSPGIANGKFDIIVRPNYTYEIGEISIGKSPTNSEELAVNVDVEKLKDIDSSVCIFAAAYDKNGALIGMDNTQANLDLHQESTFTFHIPTNGNTVGSVKAYVWDALDTMNPQAEVKSLNAPFPLHYQKPSGNGTENSPYEITSPQELAYIFIENTKYYILRNNIDLSAYEWIPYTFSGTLDGQGNRITGLSIDSNTICSGFVSCLRPQTVSSEDVPYGYYIPAYIKNLDVEIINSGKNATVSGSITGEQYALGEIINCNSSGNITANSHKNNGSDSPAIAGGISGLNMGGTIQNCTSDINVTGFGKSSCFVGGIVGKNVPYVNNLYPKILNCESSGTVKAYAQFNNFDNNQTISGGIAGYNDGLIESCTTSAKLYSDGISGGITGYFAYDDYSKIYNCIDNSSILSIE